MPKRSTDYRRRLLQDLADPVEASHYLNAARADSREAFLRALRDVAESRQMTKVAADAGVSRESLYRMTCETGNPTHDSFEGILRALELDYKIIPSGSTEEHSDEGPLADLETSEEITETSCLHESIRIISSDATHFTSIFTVAAYACCIGGTQQGAGALQWPDGSRNVANTSSHGEILEPVGLPATEGYLNSNNNTLAYVAARSTSIYERP